MKYLLDTNIWSYLQASHPTVLTHFQRLSPQDELFISVISQAELLSGLRMMSNKAKQAQLLTSYQQLMLNQVAEILPVTTEVITHYADILVQLRQIGRPIPTNDIWIAAIALTHQLILVTNDAHFQHVANLPLEDWTKL